MLTTLFNPKAPYSAISSALYERYIAPAIQKQNQLLFDTVFHIERLPDGAKILDVGCGSGSLLSDFYDRNNTFELTGIDQSADQVRRASLRVKGLNRKIEILKANAEQLPFPDDYFDFI